MYVRSLILGHELTIFFCKHGSPLRQNVTEVLTGKYILCGMAPKAEEKNLQFFI